MDTENETTDTAEFSEEESADYGAVAVAAVALAGAGALGVIAGRNYGKARDWIRSRRAARLDEAGDVSELSAIDANVVED